MCIGANPEHGCGDRCQGTGWGLLAPSTQAGMDAQVPQLALGPGFNGLSELSEGQARQLGRALERLLAWVRGFIRVGCDADLELKSICWVP